jgi:hypothetical protein
MVHTDWIASSSILPNGLTINFRDVDGRLYAIEIFLMHFTMQYFQRLGDLQFASFR